MYQKPIINHQVIEVFLDNIVYSDKEIVDKTITLTKKMNFNVVNELHHEFEPHGISVVLVLAESHLGLHYWPENYYLHIDLVTCVKEGVDIAKLKSITEDVFKVREIKIKDLKY